MKNTAADNVEITICMGSSCFARGNGANLEFLEQFIEENGLEARITLSGSRCEGRCADGPNIIINGVLFQGFGKDELEDKLKEVLCQQEQKG